LPEGGWKWHGGAVGGDGNIYCVPSHATRVLKIDVASSEVKMIGPELPGSTYKWGGACMGHRGAVYFFPSDYGRVLKVACDGTDEVTEIGPEFPAGSGTNKWQNGFLGADGAVYGLPCNYHAVLRISADDEVTTLGGPWEGKEKWEGGVMAPSGVIYAVPQQATAVLRIDPLGRPPGFQVQATSGACRLRWLLDLLKPFGRICESSFSR